MRRLRLRGRLTVMSAGIVGLVLVLGSVAAYVAVRGALRDQVDDQLRGQATFVRVLSAQDPGFGGVGGPPRSLQLQLPVPRVKSGGPIDLAQKLTATGSLERTSGDIVIPVTATDRGLAAAAGKGAAVLSDRTAQGVHLRVITVPVSDGALQLARPLTAVDGALHDLRTVLALLVVVGTAAAALLARVFSKPALEPVTELTEAAEHIEATGDLGRRLEPRSDDEVGRMASSFNAMLDRVQESVEAQRRLAADASHELRTPVSALRTNVEVLAEAGDRLDVEQRRVILDDVVAQADELGALVAGVIELARGEEMGGVQDDREDVRLDALVAEAVDRARRHAPAVVFTTTLTPCVVPGAAERLARAINNLLDNAAKYGPPAGPVEVGVMLDGADAALTVVDHGPGVDPAEAEHIFDRFARGAVARERAGSGLGLAIVRQVAEAHGGRVRVEEVAGGGACFVLSLPGAVAV